MTCSMDQLWQKENRQLLPKVQTHLLFAPVIPRLRICPAGIPTHILWCMSKIIYYSVDDVIERLVGNLPNDPSTGNRLNDFGVFTKLNIMQL